jgi:crotonobetainyl-CoA:carnitine CoA-transferase CaiB-like acyl-CoA transferase
VNRLDDHARDPELAARGLLYTARPEGSDGRRYPQVGLGIAIDGSSASYRLPPPRLGEHGGQVLRDWLGYDAAAIERLREQKLI